MTTYKGTYQDMKCHEFQYEIGKKVVLEGAVRCGNVGTDSFVCPMDAETFYPPAKGTRYFACEATGTIDKGKDWDSRIASSELTLTKEIGLSGLIEAQVEYVKNHSEGSHAKRDSSHAAAQGARGNAVAQGARGNAVAQGASGNAVAQGYSGNAVAQGARGHGVAQGTSGNAVAQGECGHAAAHRDWGHAAAQGDNGHAVAQGHRGHAVAQGARGNAVAQGALGHAVAQGDNGHAVAQGENGNAAAQGECGHAEVHGADAIAAVFGIDGQVMAGKVGAWLTAYEWDYDGSDWHIKAGKCVRVDGEKIKPNVWYTLKNGEFVEVEE